MEDRSVLDRPARVSDADFYFGDPARPVIVLLHGGFWRPEWDRTHLRPMAAALSDLGWPVLLPEFRRIPGDPQATVDDVRSAIAAIGGPIVLMGHSAGGHLALLASSPAVAGSSPAVAGSSPAPAASSPAPAATMPAATLVRSRIVGTIALAPAADLAMCRELDLDGGAVNDFLGQHDSALYQPMADNAVIIHGADDKTVPIEVSNAYVARHPGVRLVTLPGEGHFALIDPLSRAWPNVIDELNRLLA